MCCFTRPVHVSKTRIFARAVAHGHQLLAYQMTYSSIADVAMILPLPVPKGTGERGLRFINLEGYPAFFDDLAIGFPDGPPTAGASLSNSVLAVEKVGSFEASFIPTIKDFARLDERFQLDPEVWDDLPAYRDYGFAVFQLRQDAHTVHPMAFEFPRADSHSLFFPTVHIHDGEVHPEAEFDHALYCQAPPHTPNLGTWRESELPTGLFMHAKKAAGLLESDEHVYLMNLSGKRKNADVTL